VGDFRRIGAHLRIATGGEAHMSKGLDRKKDAKKKPTKTLKEKRAAKAEKREQKKWMPT
jgi:hypothetical protein